MSKQNDLYINITTEISDDYHYWANVTPPECDRLQELELKRDIFNTTKVIIDALMSGQTEAISTPTESKIIFGRSGGRALLIKALDEAEKRVIINCPWLSQKSIDKDLLLKFGAFLAQGGCIDIGWGYQYDVGKIIKISGNGKYFIDAKGNEWQSYSALPKLHELQESYPSQFKLKLLGTHAKYWICDRKFAYVGSHNVLSSKVKSVNNCYPDLLGDEVGTLHRSLHNIQKLIKGFENQPDLSDALNKDTIC